MVNWIEIAAQRPVCNVGQLDKLALAALNSAVRRGTLVKRRAPFAGRFGAEKTYFAASNEAFDAYLAEQVARFDLAAAMDAANR